MDGGQTQLWSKQPGTYALLLNLERRALLRVGRLGTLDLSAGWYVYVGSALGPGGLRARLLRHCRNDKRLHWHIDYFLGEAMVRGVWYAESSLRLECVWAFWLQGRTETTAAVPHFGASDCDCLSHLFFLTAGVASSDLMEGIQSGLSFCSIGEARSAALEAAR